MPDALKQDHAIPGHVNIQLLCHVLEKRRPSLKTTQPQDQPMISCLPNRKLSRYKNSMICKFPFTLGQEFGVLQRAMPFSNIFKSHWSVRQYLRCFAHRKRAGQSHVPALDKGRVTG